MGGGVGVPSCGGMKHASPFIAEGAGEAERAGIQRLVGIPLAPHFAELSLGAYQHSLQTAWHGELGFVPGFPAHPAFIRALQKLIAESLRESAPPTLFFTPHP